MNNALYACGLTLVVLKLAGFIQLSWWIVLAPFYAVPFVFGALFILIAAAVGATVLTAAIRARLRN